MLPCIFSQKYLGNGSNSTKTKTELDLISELFFIVVITQNNSPELN